MSKSAVRSQMPKMAAKTSTSTRQMSGPFDAPRDTGNGGIPTHVMESLGEKAASTVSAGFASPQQAGTHQKKNGERYPE